MIVLLFMTTILGHFVQVSSFLYLRNPLLPISATSCNPNLLKGGNEASLLADRCGSSRIFFRNDDGDKNDDNDGSRLVVGDAKGS